MAFGFVDPFRYDGLHERVQATRRRSLQLQYESGVLIEATRRILADCLERNTGQLDAGLVHPILEHRVERLAAMVGRDPTIEQAKAALAGEYGITRGDAFELLCQISSRRNVKLRGVARNVAAHHSLSRRAANR